MSSSFNCFVTYSLLFYMKQINSFEVDLLLSYQKVTESSSDRIVVDPFFNCSTHTSAIEECVNACFINEESGTGCLGFLKGADGTCNLCRGTTEKNQSVTIPTNTSFYKLRGSLNPDLHVSMDNINLTSKTVNEAHVSGTIENITLIPAKVGNGLNFGGVIELETTDVTCPCDLDQCSDGHVSVMLWTKLTISEPCREVIVPNGPGIGINLFSNGVVASWIYLLNGTIWAGVFTNYELQTGNWIHLTVRMTLGDGIYWYVNGKETVHFNSLVDIHSVVHNETQNKCEIAMVGTCNETTLNSTSIIDDLKYFYRSLTPEEIVRDYLGGQVGDGGMSKVAISGPLYEDEAEKMVDGQIASCLGLIPTSQYAPGFSAKLLNTAKNRTQFMMNMTTKNLPCDYQHMFVYGLQSPPEGAEINDVNQDTLRFSGTFQKTSVGKNNGQSACVYEVNSAQVWLYVFVRVLMIPDGADYQICDVQFY